MNATHPMIGWSIQAFNGTSIIPTYAPATPLNIPAPDLIGAPPMTAVTINTVPDNGLVTLADGVTQIQAGQVISVEQLVTLTFSPFPAPGALESTSALTYTITDAFNDITSATETIVIEPQLPPNPPTIVGIAPGSDTGLIGDLLTSAAQPLITGSGMSGDTITLFDGHNPNPIGTAIVVDGGWAIAPTVRLTDGLHSLTATETSGSETSTPSAPLPLTIDTSVPATPTLALAPQSDSGVVGDRLTNVNTPTITGTGDNGDTITLFDGPNPTPIGSATVVNGTWSITPATSLADGVHTLAARAANAAGTINGSLPLSLYIDTSVPPAPTLTLALSSDSGTPHDGLTNVNVPTFVGHGIDGDTVTLDDGFTQLGTATVVDGTWSITPTSPLADGSHPINAVQTNPAGTQSEIQSLPLLVDTSVPTAPTLALAPQSDSGAVGDRLTNVTTPTITGTGTDGDIVVLRDGASNTPIGATAVTDGTWAITLASALSAGHHTLTATQTNVAGTTSTGSTLALTIDTTIPAAPTLMQTVTATGPATPVLAGQADNGSTVLIYQGDLLLGTAVAGPQGYTFTVPSPLAAGSYLFTAVERSPAGNVSAATPLNIQVGADTTYQVITPDSAGQKASVYDPSGQLSQIVTSSNDGHVKQVVTNDTALLNIYDDAGVLIGTVGQTVGSIFTQPAFTTTAGTISAATSSTASGSVITLLNETNDITSMGPDTISAGAGTTRITANGATATVNSQASQLTFVGGAGAYNVIGGTGSSTIAGGAGGGTYQGGSAGHNLIAAGSGAATLVAGGANDTLLGGAGHDIILGGSGPVTIAGGNNGALIAGSTGNSLIATQGGSNVVFSRGADTIVGGSGTDLVGTGTNNATVFGGSGQLNFINGSGSSTVVGGAGSDTVFGTNGSGLFAAGSGGNSIVIGGQHSSILMGQANGDELFATGAEQTILVAGAGAEKLIGTSSTGNNIFYGGSGPDLIYGGSGNNIIDAGSGNSTLVGGPGSNLFTFTSGRAGGTTTILDFNAQNDRVKLIGYAAGEAAQDLSHATTAPAGVSLTLSDGTHINFVGLHTLSANAFA